ncbi:hypothetical protein [Sinomicrobium soli]|uniref:hypothetical protein n=1 Tax=Sinomicrobium sp. N-1-3-6 TaxID=2219864 RepID=UPI0011BFC169|nr:hypothetical protein [Sinomicrobium sp. N-1-3-6]
MTSAEGSRKISGIYPHLTVYAHKRMAGNYDSGQETGIGALAVWNDKLYMVSYAAHKPEGSEHNLHIVDKDKNMEIFKGSIGGTPAARMVHKETNQLFIGPYAIDSTGKVRVIPYSDMKGRLTAVARHLKDPENMVYYYDMEGMLYEVDVHTLKVNKLFHDPLPGWHGKGGYTSQGKLVLSNNGERLAKGKMVQKKDGTDSVSYRWKDTWKVPREGVFGKDRLGILAEFDGENFSIVERKQYTDVTTRHGIYAEPGDESPLWAVGWDKKSLRLTVMDQGVWSTFLLPKAAYNNDPSHGWFTEWPRIRAIGKDRMMMDMHGMFFDFPESFSVMKTAGIRPISSHLRYIPDFLEWNGQIVLATDETSVQGNPLSGQPQSNLWFGSYEELSGWGPSSAYGSVWLEETVEAGTPSLPFLFAGFGHRMIYLKNHGKTPVTVTAEIDAGGDQDWKTLKTFALEGNGSAWYIFGDDEKGEWIRLISDQASALTASFHFTDDNFHDPADGASLFEGLADADYDGEVSHAKLYSNRNNFNLGVYAGRIESGKFKGTTDLEFTKGDFEFVDGTPEKGSEEVLKEKSIWTEDEASVILKAKDYQLRLPKNPRYDSKKFPSGTVRSIREVESERELANIAGTFYEVPLYFIDQEPLYKMMRPVSTHNKQISDFNTWNGLLVMSGVRADAEASEHIYKSPDGKTALWFGGIDDLWSLGKPRGEGGPWKDAEVRAGELSDNYLMKGYDDKTLYLTADRDVKISLMVHFEHYLKEPVLYKTFEVKKGEKLEYEFPEGFSAHWVQVKADKDCKATAWFVYR